MVVVCPVARSHSRMVASQLPVARVRPSGLNAAASMPYAWPARVVTWPVSRCCSWRVPSRPGLLARMCPLGWNASALPAYLPCRDDSVVASPVARSQSRTVVILPSCGGGLAGLPRRCLAAGQGAAVRAESYRPDPAGGSGEGGDLPGSDGPQCHRLLVTCHGQGAAVGAEGHRFHAGFAGKDGRGLPGSQVPEARRDITAAGKGAPVRVERHGADPTGVTDEDDVRGEGRDRRGYPGGHPARPCRGDALLAGRRGACGTLIDPPQRLGVGDLLGGGEFAGRLLAGIAAVFGHGMLVSGGFPRSAGR